jgi:peroxiredoxin
MEGYRMLASGRAAPEITTTDINGKSFTLSEVKAQNILVVFWASWCPHCTVLLPEIKSFALELNKETSAGMPPKLKVVSVSIDHNEKDYQDYIQKQGFNDPSSESYWVNLCDFNAWDGVVASDYYLFATPTMLLLGNDRLITAKPSSIRDVANQLKK